nr:PIN domain-containing protein [Planktothricoides sp. SR001]
MDYLFDTNIFSLAIKNNISINQKIRELKAQRKSIFMSCITYFEIRRGFLAVDAPKQRARFEDFCQRYPIILLDDLAILEKAAEVHEPLRSWGLPK